MFRFMKIVLIFLFLIGFSLRATLFLSDVKKRISGITHAPVIEAGQLFELFNIYKNIVNNELLRDLWIDGMPEKEFYEFNEFYPFMQKISPKVESEIFIFGDFHGGINGLINSLEHLKMDGYIDDQLRILKSDCYFVFLGDYVDRGDYGVEVLYTILALKCFNPNQVVLLRGNHEDALMNQNNEFSDELDTKYTSLATFLRKEVNYFYETLPCALVVESGENSIFCCHGGIELGVNPVSLVQSDLPLCYQLIRYIDRSIQNLPDNQNLQDALRVEVFPTELECFEMPLKGASEHALGFLWSDFNLFDEAIVSYDYRRGMSCGRVLTQYFIDRMNTGKKRVHAIFRGHQHSGEMRKYLMAAGGLTSLWGMTVYTLLASSESLDDNLFSSFVKVTTAIDYEDWVIDHHTYDMNECESRGEAAPSVLSRVVHVWNYIHTKCLTEPIAYVMSAFDE